MSKPIIIIGGGIAGLCAGIALQKLGLEVIIFERNPEPTVVGAGIIIAPNALQALGPFGVAEKIMDEGYESNGFHMLTDQGKLITKMLVPNGFQSMYAIHRSELHRHLLEALEPGTVKWGNKCDKFEQGNGCVKVHFHDHSTLEGALLIAADGIRSPIRKSIYPENRYRYAGYTCWRGIAETDQTSGIPRTFIETWGAQGRFGIVNFPNRQVYWYALVNAEANDPILAAYSPQDLYERFRNYHEPIPSILESTPTNRMIHRDVVDIEPMEQCYADRIAFIGDAAHAITPNMGQGACQAIEDAVVLAECIASESDHREAFRRYDQRRKRRIVNISKQSWTFGKVAQLEAPILRAVRNSLIKLVPDSLMKRQAEQLYRFP
ncbi:MAG TPA: FAD-dependent monooxygenase [Candidatus Paenibacillus intestinavium]|nr:FAD-dependent monooxygenase [Candidatus Paenibacillus intestinavium]